MKNNLNMLREGIEHFDNDAERSLYFYNNPTARQQLIMEILTVGTHRIEGIQDPIQAKMRVTEILTWLDNNFQGYGWPAHEVHFHTNFMQHCGCTFTCLNEISTILEKLIKEKFAA